ncbi:hypothetical protein SAMN05216588_116132 [Pseudomonas flavescens]|uniref:Uncharacterized protein n=1 Tax=Phytopseudomonas flavescens TaxID=29435 RepID=A0A1G8KGN6_9GAMM|nr:hypothetical protein [Pseudomonas flavescens]SDI42552.1 hypothetical protein SAMN05216588_116132 [Pseudomonas flavescens]
MIALAYLAFFLAYGLISVLVVSKSYRVSRRRYGKGWVGGWFAALIMYNLVFWDWIPVYVMYKYYCATEAGAWVYKSPEQWIKENPGAVGQLWGDDYIRPIERFSDQRQRIWYSELVYGETIKQARYSGGLLRRTERLLVDARSGDELSRAVQFEKINESAFSLGHATVRDFKIWLVIGGNDCVDESGQNYFVLDARNGKELIKLGRGVGNDNGR